MKISKSSADKLQRTTAQWTQFHDKSPDSRVRSEVQLIYIFSMAICLELLVLDFTPETSIPQYQPIVHLCTRVPVRADKTLFENLERCRRRQRRDDIVQSQHSAPTRHIRLFNFTFHKGRFKTSPQANRLTKYHFFHNFNFFGKISSFDYIFCMTI